MVSTRIEVVAKQFERGLRCAGCSESNITKIIELIKQQRIDQIGFYASDGVLKVYELIICVDWNKYNKRGNDNDFHASSIIGLQRSGETSEVKRNLDDLVEKARERQLRLSYWIMFSGALRVIKPEEYYRLKKLLGFEDRRDNWMNEVGREIVDTIPDLQELEIRIRDIKEVDAQDESRLKEILALQLKCEKTAEQLFCSRDGAIGDYTVDTTRFPINISLTFQGEKKAAVLLGITSLNDPANVELKQGVISALILKEEKQIETKPDTTSTASKTSDLTAANAVSDMIKKIPVIGESFLFKKDKQERVSYESKVHAAREAYNALNPRQKELVRNYSRLKSAEETLEGTKQKLKQETTHIIIAMSIDVAMALILAVTLFNQVLFNWFISHCWVSLGITALLFSTSNIIIDTHEDGERVSVLGSMGVLLTVLPLFLSLYSWQKLGDISFLNNVSGNNLNILPICALFLGLYLQVLNESANLGEYYLERHQSRKNKVLIYTWFGIVIGLFNLGAYRALTYSTTEVSEAADLNISDSVTFGLFEQDGDLTNGAEELLWTVYDIQDGKALLICDTCIEAMPFNTEGTDNSWGNSDIRSWLNNEFYSSAFTSDEQAIIIDSAIITNTLSDYDETRFQVIPGREETTIDNVFIPGDIEFGNLSEGLDVSQVAKEHFVANNTLFGQESYEPMFWSREPFGNEKNFAHGYQVDTNEEMGYTLPPAMYALIRPTIYINIEGYRDLFQIYDNGADTDSADQQKNDSELTDKDVHYYNWDLESENYSFGPNCYYTLSAQYSGDELTEQIYSEFCNRLEHDPVFAVACLAYADEEMGTRYTGKFYSEIEDNWLIEINIITIDFLIDIELWDGEVAAFESMLNNSTYEIETISNFDINTLWMESGDVMPLILSGSTSSEGPFHLLTFTLLIKDSELHLSYVIEDGFTPVLGYND